MNSLPKTYRYNPEGIALMERKLRMFRNLLFCGIIAVFVAMDFSAAENWKDGSLKTLLPHLITITFVFAVLVLSFRRGIDRQRRTLASYELVVGQDFVVRRMSGLNDMEVRRYEVTAIRKNKQGLILQTASADRTLTIPDSLADFEDIRDALSQWRSPIEQESPGWKQSRYLLPVVIVVELVLFGLFFVSNNKLLEVATGFPLLVGLLWCLVLIQKSSQLDQKIKRKMWLLLLPLFAIAARLTLAILHWR